MHESYHIKPKRLDIIERTKIELLCGQGRSQSYIAANLGWAKSTISDELKRGTYKGKYQAHIAQKRADAKHNGRPKLLMDRELMHEVERMLKLRWSPQIISNKLCGRISHTTIYTLCHTNRKEWHKHLVYQRQGRYHKGLVGKTLIPDRADIRLRGEVGFGDWEADTVISSRDGKSCLGVFVEKTTRLYKIVKMMNKTADEMIRAALIALEGLPVRSITYDNGLENAGHGWVKRILGCASWFCRAYRSTDKAQIENRNKQLRIWLPKGTNFDLIGEAELGRIETSINERPMKCLNWLSPAQAFGSYL